MRVHLPGTDFCDESFGKIHFSAETHLANASQQRYLARMLVCICNAISEDELRDIARQGINEPEAAFAALGKRPNCGTCLDHADDILFAEQRRQGSAHAPAAQPAPAFISA